MANKSAFSLLNLDQTLARASDYAKGEGAKKAILSSRPFPEKELLDQLALLEEAYQYIEQNGEFPLRGGNDLLHALSLGRKGRSFEEKELYDFAEELSCAEKAKSDLEKEEGRPHLFALGSSLVPLPELSEAIFKTVSPSLEILSSASSKLRKIRNDIERVKREITNILPGVLSRYASYLSDMTYAFKNGHYALPVSSSYKHLVRGLVQDISASENTVFIEPEEILEKDNKMQELFAEERVEIARVLRELTSHLIEHAEEIETDIRVLQILDVLQAKIRYGQSLGGHIGSLSEDGSLFLPFAFHPLLEVEKVVKNNFSFTSKKRVIIVSGPNAGGKTVALKTLGICVLLFEMAFPLPCGEGAIVPYFKHVYADIGDNQSLEENLSTFSAHIASLASITSDIGGKDLLLLDEVGTGTSPNEGEALAKAIIDFILQKHSYAFLSSHFEGVKQYALSKEGVAIASMIFDTDKRKPTYVLSMGTIGESFGLEIARDFGLDQRIIDNAMHYRDEGEDKTLKKALSELSVLSKEAKKANDELASRLSDIKKKEGELKNKEHALKAREEKLLSAVEEKKKRMLEEAENEIEEAMRGVKGNDVKPHQLIEARKRLSNLHKKEDGPALYDEVIRLGDYVSIPDMGIEGKVVSLSKTKAEVIERKGFRFKVETIRLHKIPKPDEEEEVSPMQGSLLDAIGNGPSLAMELNIIGLYADEAKLELERYLDACRRKGFHRVRIIHGFGTGALRKMTHEYLKKRSDFVDRYESAGEAEGAGGATIVYLK